MTEIIYLVVYALAAYGLGSFSLQSIKFRSLGEEAFFAQAFGLIFFAFVTFFIGMIGLLSSLLFKMGFALLLLVFFSRIKKYVLYLWSFKNSKYRTNFESVLVVVLIVFVIMNFIAALAPVHSSDAISYHIALPKIWAEQGAITGIPHMVMSNYPIGLNMLFLDGFLLNGGILSELIAFYIGLLFMLGIYFFGARYFSKRIGLLGAVIFYTMPIFSVFNIRGFVDISTGLFAFLALYLFFMWQESPRIKYVALSAISVGFAASIKTSAMLLPLVIGALFAYYSLFVKRNIKATFTNSLIFGIVAVLIMAPWTIRTFIQTGSPVYPVYNNIFGGEFFSEVLARYWIEIHTVGMGNGILDLILLPWNLTMHSPAFGEVVGVGPLFLATIPVILLMSKVDFKVKLLFLAAILFVLQWFFTSQNIRYIFMVYAILAVLSAYAISWMMSNKSLRSVGVLSFGAVIFFNAAVWAGANLDEVKVVAGLDDEENFLKLKVSNYGLLSYANQNLDDANICLYGEIRGYYSDNEYVICHPAYQGYIDFAIIDNGPVLLSRFKEIGVTHLLVEESLQQWREIYDERNIEAGITLINNGGRAVKDLIESGAAKLIYENEEGQLYELVYEQ